MAVTIDPAMAAATPTAAVLPVELPLSERRRLVRRAHRRAGTHDLLVSAAFTVAALMVIAIALFSLIGR